MVMMNEAVVVLMICGLWVLGGFALYQRLFVIRGLRKRVEKYAELALVAAPASAGSPVAGEPGELKRIQKRLEVLERIAVEKENGLAREIEDLRAANG
jgi:hypothetical protein